MKFLTANFSGEIRRESLNGRTYLVAPATILVSGVLNGSKGSLFYPQDEVEAHPGLWNNVPITKGHPTDENGSPVSARHPEILEQYGLGYVFNDEPVDGKRIVELWFDENLTKNKAPKIYQKLDVGEEEELSTGLYTEDYPAKNGSTFNGKPFDFVARNYRPDHLAILEGQKGACSIKDGCGVLVKNESDKSYHERMDELGALLRMRFSPPPFGDSDEMVGGTYIEELYDDHIVFRHKAKLWRLDYSESNGQLSLSNDDPTEVMRRTVYETVENFLSNLAENLKHGQPRSQETGKFKHMGAGTGKGKVHKAAQKGALVISDKDKELAASLEISENGELTVNPPQWVQDESKWKKAEGAADEAGYTGETYWQAATAIYKKMGGGIKSSSNNNSNNSNNSQTKGIKMPIKTKNRRKENIQFLTNNCECWQGLEKTLNNMTDERLEKLRKQAVVANTLLKGVPMGSGLSLTFNESKGHPVFKTESGEECSLEDALSLSVNQGDDDDDDDDDDDEDEETPNKKNKADDDDDDDEDKKKKPPFLAKAAKKNKSDKKKDMAKNQSFSQMIEQHGSAEEKAIWNAARQVELERRQNLVKRLVANLDGEEKEKMAAKLLKKTVPELQELAALIPSEDKNSSLSANANEDLSFLYANPPGNYSGAAPGGVVYSLTENEQEEVLDIDEARKGYDPLVNRQRATAS